MIKIRDSSLNMLAYLDVYTNATVTESINAAPTLNFTAMVDDEKSQYIVIGNIIEVEEQYFNIVRTRRSRDSSGQITLGAYCEQLSYDLLYVPWQEFVQAGTPADLLSLLLAGTDFTIGTVELSDVISVDVKEESTAMAILLAIVTAAGGELLFDKYEISLLVERGENRGVRFQFGKNLLGIIKDADNSSGTLKIAYEVDVVELNFLPEYEGIEYFELGDTIRIVDPELGIDELQRIVEYTYDPKQRINSSVKIANFIDKLQDTIVNIQTTTVVKDKLYYNTRIGPTVGFEATRSDQKGRAVMNGDGIVIQKGNGSGSYSDVIFLDTDGNANFKGTVSASTIIGSTVSASTINGSVINGTNVNGGTITGALIQTSASYPRSEMSVSNNYFAAFADADTYAAIAPASGLASVPVLLLVDGGTIKAFLNRSLGITTLGTFDGETLNLQPSGNLAIGGTNGISGAFTIGSSTLIVSKGIVTGFS